MSKQIYTKNLTALSQPATQKKVSLKKRFKLVVVSIVGLLGAFALLLWIFWDQPLVTPLTELTTFNFISKLDLRHSNNKLVYGFLPYWNLDDFVLRDSPRDQLTHLGYFGLTIGSDGNIITRLDGGLEPGYNRLLSDEWLVMSNQLKKGDAQIEIVLTQFDNDDIVALLSSDQALENLVVSLENILLSYPVSGVNIDIEYTGEVTDSLRDKLATLVEKLRFSLDKKYDHVQLSIDMYASAASREQIWDVERIGKSVDYIVVMAYDFHRRSSAQAGPVAPLFGGKELWDSDINQHLKAFIEKVPREKILLGVPFYGYEWQTTSRESQAHTLPDTGSTASYERVQELLQKKEELQVQEHWNEAALSPYISYIEDDETYVVYYENSRSLSYKLDYVNQLDLAGIAIWALGYEGDSNELWEVIDRKI